MSDTNRSPANEPLHVFRAGGITLFDVALGLLSLSLLAAGVLLLVVIDVTAPALSLLLCGLAVLGVWIILPHRFEIFADRLAIVFPLWRWQIPFEQIVEVRETRWWEPYGFAGLRFATDPGKAVAIIRRNSNLILRPNVVISPQDRRAFLDAIRTAMTASES